MTSDYNWWVSGGLDKDENPLKTSEVRWLNGTWTPGPVLPTKVYGHCVTQIQRQKSVLIGGYPSHDNYIYDWITKVSALNTIQDFLCMLGMEPYMRLKTVNSNFILAVRSPNF